MHNPKELLARVYITSSSSLICRLVEIYVTDVTEIK